MPVQTSFLDRLRHLFRPRVEQLAQLKDFQERHARERVWTERQIREREQQLLSLEVSVVRRGSER